MWLISNKILIYLKWNVIYSIVYKCLIVHCIISLYLSMYVFNLMGGYCSNYLGFKKFNLCLFLLKLLNFSENYPVKNWFIIRSFYFIHCEYSFIKLISSSFNSSDIEGGGGGGNVFPYKKQNF